MFKVLEWLATKDIFIEITASWDEDGTTIEGFVCQAWVPPYSSNYIGPPMLTYKDAIEIVLFRLLDYI